ncbi:MAG TPA: VOC family protein [Tepidisphaeraceae bacterium]|jgi:catechol 2,3-dioxygenase-like lactoylglutathione lyase family enzyme|nr:VOC family protein [Tepidisphaeraceae bacterium]
MPPPSPILKIHHAQITVAASDLEAARSFYCQILGLTEIPKPTSLQSRGGLWLRAGQHELHIGIEENPNRSATKAHIAYEVTKLRQWQSHLQSAGVKVLDSVPIPGHERFEFRDPFGNRVELIEPKE